MMASHRKNVAMIFNSLNIICEIYNLVKKVTANVTKEGLKATPTNFYLKSHEARPRLG
jgi:hypothetical protein